jgi:TM2 domain-containing membrane protein YozV
MTSLTQIAHGSRDLRQGKSRRHASYQRSSRRRSVATCARDGAASSSALVSKSRPDPGVAAVLSLIVPGVGQIYNGAFLRGIFWLIVTPGFWIGSGGTLGWICHLIAAYTAFSYAKRRL